MKPSSIDQYAKAFERVPRTAIPVRTIPVEPPVDIDIPETNTNNANNDPDYYYCSMRIGDKNISVKLRVSLIAYMVVSLGIEGDRREIQKVLYKIMHGYKIKKAAGAIGAAGINAVIADKILEEIINKKEDRVASTDYRIYCGKLGGQVKDADNECHIESNDGTGLEAEYQDTEEA